MNKKILWLIAFLLLVSSNIGEAQQPKRISRIGYLAPVFPCSGSVSSLQEFQQGLHDLGYVEDLRSRVIHRVGCGVLGLEYRAFL
jgi:hypothetical protein